MKAVPDAVDEACDVQIGWVTSPRKISVELGIRQLQNRFKTRHIGSVQISASRLQKGLQDRVELAHAATTTPSQLCNEH